ncbi:MAG: T9SS type A sorting domain-containing protein [Bacteroidia bacterium]
MKKITLLFLMTGGLCATLAAQPVLTAAGIMPVVGNVLSTTNGGYVNPGPAGANQTWNLAFANGGASTSTGVTPGSTPYAANFPQSTVSLPGGGAYVYYKGTAAAWQNCGLVDPNGVVLAYSDFEDILHFPFTYTNTYTDTWATTFVSSSTTYYRSGTTTVTADAYGTLTTPDGTFTNVTRVHFYQVYSDSANMQSQPVILEYENDEYMWYLNGNHSVIAAVYILTPDFTSTIMGGFYMNNVVSGVNDFSALTALSLAPNPANDVANFNIELNEAKELNVTIYNYAGQEIGKSITTAGFVGENKIAFSVAELAAGSYFAIVSLDGVQASSQKIVVTH